MIGSDAIGRIVDHLPSFQNAVSVSDLSRLGLMSLIHCLQGISGAFLPDMVGLSTVPPNFHVEEENCSSIPSFLW